MRFSKYGHRFDWRRDLPNHKYALFNPQFNVSVTLPDSIDLRSLDSPVLDQGNFGSCTGNALAGWMSFQFLKVTTDPFSRLFIYYNERKIEGDADQDAGASLSDGVKSLIDTGVCKESEWPYNDNLLFQQPSPTCYLHASNFKISKASRILDLQGIKQSLVSGNPVPFGFSVFENFETDAVANGAPVEFPSQFDEFLGGHAVLAVGYEPDYLICRNSWGVNWGMNGYFKLSNDYVNRGLATDFWSLSR